MLNKLRDLAAMKKKAGEMKKMMSEEKVNVETFDGNINLTMNGSQEIEALTIDAEILKPENKERLEKEIKKAIEKATKEVQQILARKAMSGELNLPF